MSVRTELAKSIAARQKRLRGAILRRCQVGPHLPEIASYRQMLEDNLAASGLYTAGRFWQDINEEFADFLWAGAINNVRTEYFNRRFSGPDPCSRQVWRALLWLYYQRLKAIDSEGFLKHAAEPSHGGTSDQELIDGRPMSLDFLQSVEEVYCLKEAWKQAGRTEPPQVFVELGAGYGRLAYACRQMLPHCTYVILDLPEALICASHWLGKVLPAECVPYKESRAVSSFTRDILISRKVWTLGAQQIESIASNATDVFVNIYSFGEMPRLSLNNYFSQADRITDGILYSKQRKLERNTLDDIEMGANSYPVPNRWRKLFERTTTLYEAFFEAAYAIPR